MGILKNLKRRFGMAKRFKGGIKEDIVKEVEEIAQRVAEEKIEIEEDIPEGKMRKKEFLISKVVSNKDSRNSLSNLFTVDILFMSVVSQY